MSECVSSESERERESSRLARALLGAMQTREIDCGRSVGAVVVAFLLFVFSLDPPRTPGSSINKREPGSSRVDVFFFCLSASFLLLIVYPAFVFFSGRRCVPRGP